MAAAAPEVAAELRAVLDRIEWNEALERARPAERTVTLPEGRHTVADVLRAVREQAGVRIVAQAVNLRSAVQAGWKDAPPLRVLDDLCARLGRGSIVAPALTQRADEDEFRRMGHRPRPMDVVVLDGGLAPPPAVAYSGRLRAAITDVTVSTKRSLDGDGESAGRPTVSLALTAAPGPDPVYIGDWRIEEAVDDAGTSVAPPGGGAPRFRQDRAPALGDHGDSVWFANGRFSSMRSESLELGSPAPGAKRLRLRARLLVAWPVREVVRAVRVPARGDTAEIAFGRRTFVISSVEQSASSFGFEAASSGDSDGTWPPFELLDADDRRIQTSGSSASGSPARRTQNWTCDGNSVHSIRVRGWMGHRASEAVFEWTDVPLPKEDE
jgi:hypothetical protein